MYQPYPASGPQQAPDRLTRPETVKQAVQLMYAGAALSAISIVIDLLTFGSFKSAVLGREPSLTAAQLKVFEAVGLTIELAGWILAIAAWLWMAWAISRGRNWARTVSLVLFVVNSLELFYLVARPHAVVDLIIPVLAWLTGIGVLALIFGEQARPYFRQPDAVPPSR